MESKDNTENGGNVVFTANGGIVVSSSCSNLDDKEMPNMTPLQAVTPDDEAPFSKKFVVPGAIDAETLLELSKTGDAESVETILKSVPRSLKTNSIKEINARDEKRMTALHFAAKYNHVDVARVLIEYGANPTARDEDGFTPLHHAVRFIQFENNDDNQTNETRKEDTSGIISLLIESGAYINDRDRYGHCPLHFAAIRGNELACRQLLQHKTVDIEVRDELLNTPLHMAVSFRKPRIIKLLIDSGAYVRVKDEMRSTPLHLCSSDHDGLTLPQLYLDAANQRFGPAVVKELMQDKDIEGNTCLHLAVSSGRYVNVKLFLKNGADVNTQNAQMMSPLHVAAINGDKKMVKMLLKKGAKIDVLSKEKTTPLCIAIQYNHVQIVELLIKKGADIEKRVKKNNYTPLLIGCMYGHANVVDILLREVADITAVDDNGKTGIYLAVERDNLSCLKVILGDENMREMVNDVDEYKTSPLHVAAQKGFDECLKKLIQHNGDPNCKNEEEKTPLHLAAELGRKEVVKLLVSNGGLLRTKDEDGNTPLHCAALGGHAETASLLIELGADKEAVNSFMWTPLECAAAKGWTKTAVVLLEAEAPVNGMSDSVRTTPLHEAARYGQADMINLLLSWKADVHLLDREGNNCLDVAIENHKSKAAIAIINSSHWKDALRNSTFNAYVGKRETPMRKMIKEMPDVAKVVLDKCTNVLDINKTFTDEGRIKFLYEFMDDAYYINFWRDCQEEGKLEGSECLFNEEGKLRRDADLYTDISSKFKENHPLTIMVTSKRESLLQHPLVAALLRRKWQSWTNRFFYMNYMMYIVFLVFITGYLVSTTPPYVEDASVRALTSNPHYCGRLHTSGYNQPTFAKIGKYIVTILAAWNLLREILQLYQAKLSYISWENLIELVTYICALLFVNDFEECQKSTGYRHVWQWNAGTIAVLLAWINLVLFSQKFLFGLYVVMLKDILSTFLRFFLLFMLLIVGFALAFFATLQNQNSFGTVWQSLVKTTVMMIGEFEYDTIYTEGQVNSEVLGYLLFYVFMIFMTIIVMNLMVGLAVDNIKGIQDQAELTRKGMQIELALDIETLWPDFIRRKFVCLEECIQVDFSKRTLLERITGKKSFGFTAESIKNIINPESTEVDELRETIADIQKDQKEIKEMLTALMSDRRNLVEETS